MDSVVQAIREGLADEGLVFVFPSEIASAFWRRKALSLSDRPSVAEERFISWDTFKEKAFSISRERKPVNRYVRYLFASSILKENGGTTPLFKRLVYPEYAEHGSAHLGAFMAMLPCLKDTEELLKRNPEAVEGAYREDIEYLFSRYTSFLEANGLFEPSYDRAGIKKLDGAYLIFFPRVLEDFNQYRDQLSQLPNIRTTEPSMGDLPRFTLFENSRSELTWLLGRIESLLDRGVKPWEIAVTLTRDEDWEAELLRGARLRGIPLDIRGGRPLSEYPAGRLFSQIEELTGEDFSYRALANFFLNPAYPFTRRAPGRDLLSFGRRHSCFIAHERGPDSRDVWEEKLTKAGDQDLLRFYRQFKKAVAAVTGAKDFPSLRNAIQGFINRYFNTEDWAPGSLKVFQFCMDTLSQLIEAASEVKGVETENPYRLFTRAIGERIYVERPEEGGIPVYPYRVSAGIYPACHFIPGASQESVRCVDSAYPFLKDDQKQALGASDSDMSEDFLRLYARSGGSVEFSGSETGFRGPGLVPGLFVAQGLAEKKDGEATAEKNPFLREARSFDGFVYPVMREGLVRIASTYTHGQWKGRVKADVTSKIGGEGKPSAFYISPSDLESYAACPISYLLTRFLSVEEEEYEPVFHAPRVEGILQHEVFSALFSFIKETDGAYRKEREGSYLQRIESAVREAAAGYEERGEDLISPVWTEMKESLMEHGRRLVENESELYPDWEPEIIEDYLGLDLRAGKYPDIVPRFRLSGRIDRLSVKDGRAHIVDYKRNRIPARSDIDPPAGKPVSFQMPFYLYLAEENGYAVSRVSYYQVDSDSYATVYGEGEKKASIYEGNKDRVRERLLEEIGKMADGIEQGFYPLPNDCDGCGLRSVCRAKFSIR
jgi:RecB family exonuclease